MRVLVVPPVRVKRDSLPSAFDAVFGPAMLRRVHGPDTQVGLFDKNQRRFSFRVAVPEVPPQIRRFFCGTDLKVTTRQHLGISSTKWQVTNKMKLHFVGSEFFKLRPVFWLEERAAGDGVEVYLGGSVRHDAVLPPPLNGIAEAFMMASSEKELRHFGQCLAEAGVVDPAQPSRPVQDV